MFRKFNALVIPTAILTTLLLTGTIVLPAIAATSGPKILLPSLNKYIGVKWWKWAFSFPRDESPLTDATGERCDKGLQGKSFFLAGVAGPIADPAHTERICSTPIDHNKIITFPVLNAACLLGDVCEHPREPVTDIKELKRQVKEQVDAVGTVEAEVDHKSIDLTKARVQSPLFRVDVAEDNPFDQPPDFPIPPGNFIGFADGYWVSIQPNSLSVGPHEIHFKGTVPVGNGFPDFVLDVTYHITIK
jgi:hypothetical protein